MYKEEPTQNYDPEEHPKHHSLSCIVLHELYEL